MRGINMDYKKIILFDWGNVLLDGNTSRYTIFNARNDIAVELAPKDDAEFIQMFNEREFWTLNGECLNRYIEEYLSAAGCECTVDEFKNCYLKYYRRIPWYEEMIQLTKDLISDGRFCLGILSTLCELDKELLKERLLLCGFQYHFFSFNLGVQKPDNKIYEIVETVTGYDGQDILFIDDMQQNIAAAQNRGWKTVLATGNDVTKIRKICYQFYGITTERS